MEQITIHDGALWHLAERFTQSTGAIECCIVVLGVLIVHTLIKAAFK